MINTNESSYQNDDPLNISAQNISLGQNSSSLVPVHKGKKSDHQWCTYYMCQICNASFPHLRNLKVHITSVHEGKKSHKCDICGSRFAERGKLTRHIRHVHEKKKPFECTICGNTFAYNQHLKSHISSVHDGIKPHACSICNASFARKSHLKRHIDSVHGKEMEVMPEMVPEIIMEPEMDY